MTLSPISLEAAQRAFRNSDRLDRPTEASVATAIEAFLAAEAERGVRLMPSAPTSKMVDAGTAKWNSVSTAPRRASIEFDNEVYDVWQAMFDSFATSDARNALTKGGGE